MSEGREGKGVCRVEGGEGKGVSIDRVRGEGGKEELQVKDSECMYVCIE